MLILKQGEFSYQTVHTDFYGYHTPNNWDQVVQQFRTQAKQFCDFRVIEKWLSVNAQ